VGCFTRRAWRRRGSHGGRRAQAEGGGQFDDGAHVRDLDHGLVALCFGQFPQPPESLRLLGDVAEIHEVPGRRVVLQVVEQGAVDGVLLPPLDDHLNDGQLPASHLHLLLRSQAWMMMNAALECLSAGIDGGEKFVRHCINDYYSSICNREEVECLDSYCEHFRKQMATWMIAPLLLAKKLSPDAGFTGAIQSAYGSFGIAWRLLDDLRDIEADMIKGEHSAVYVCLPEDKRQLWDKQTGRKLDSSNEYAKAIGEFVLKTGSINRIKERICRELESAGAIADRLNMPGLKNEFISLLQPIKNKPDST